MLDARSRRPRLRKDVGRPRPLARPSPTARRWRWSARTAPARRPRCRRSAASCARRAARSDFRTARSTARATERLVREGIALVPEGRQIFATLTVAENLRLPTAGLGRERRPRRRSSPSWSGFRSCATGSTTPPAGSRAASSSSSRSPARCSAARSSCCSTSRRSGWRRSSSTWCSRRSPTFAPRGDDPARRAERDPRRRSSPTAPTCSAPGKLVLTGTREELRDTELLTASYLGARADRAGPA